MPTIELTDAEAKILSEALEKAMEAKRRGDQTLAESRTENAKGFLTRATKALELNTNELGRLVHRALPFDGTDETDSRRGTGRRAQTAELDLSRAGSRDSPEEELRLAPAERLRRSSRAWVAVREFRDFLWDEKELAKKDEDE